MPVKIFSLLLLLFSLQSFAQEIPSGSCGLLMTYDAAGNRIKREYFCNNGSNRIANPELARLNSEVGQAKQQEAADAGFEEVDALYPNPTTGKFYISFSKAIDNATIQVVDINGKVVQRVKGSGTRLEFDLSKQPSGTYFILIHTDGVIINKKIIRAK
ncbi:MAG: T9SS type A sorting domain-containing protein [Chitinophagaceae bacterium]|nr:T9SS type A sorting domain-containing protein [Chitinophagaceae bacterium]